MYMHSEINKQMDEQYLDTEAGDGRGYGDRHHWIFASLDYMYRPYIIIFHALQPSGLIFVLDS